MKYSCLVLELKYLVIPPFPPFFNWTTKCTEHAPVSNTNSTDGKSYPEAFAPFPGDVLEDRGMHHKSSPGLNKVSADHIMAHAP